MLQLTVLNDIVNSIVSHQKSIIGPLAIEQAKKVSGIKESGSHLEVTTSENKAKELLSELVSRYAELFGRASVEACKDAVKELKPSVKAEELPEVLR